MEFIQYLAGLAAAAGAASGPIFSLMWWLERADRKSKEAEVTALHEQFVELQEKTLDVFHKNADATKDVRELFINFWNNTKMLPSGRHE